MSAYFPSDFFSANREKLLNELGRGGLVVVTGHGLMQRSNDSAYKFDQEANFWYLTGINHPDWWLIIDGIQGRSWLVRPDVDDVRTLFDGNINASEALATSGVDAIIDRTEARQLLGKLRGSHTVAYSLLPQAELNRYGFAANPTTRELQDELRGFRVQDCRKELARLRAIKQPLEITAIQKAVDITAVGFKLVRENISKLKTEYEVEAYFNYEFRRCGAMGHAYEPIIAAGRNACTLHYIENSGAFSKRSWLLMDVGARFEHYAADITRSLPVQIKAVSKRQLAVYEAVLKVRDAAIKLCVPGQSIAAYYQMVDECMARELVGLKLITDDKDEEGLRRYFPHSVSHGLGVDVHDPLGRPTQLATNMVLTVEPGIYIPEEHLGIRIEDDILITEAGPKNLSAKIPTKLS